MATDIFLDLDGVTGESLDSTYKDKIDVLSWRWGMRQSGTTHMGGGGGSGKVAVDDLLFTHYVDKATNTLAKFCCDGKHIKKGKLIVRKAGETPLEYYILELEEIIVTNIASGGTGSEDRFTETVTLNFKVFRAKYKFQAADGSGAAGPECNWDIAGNKAA
jgi:type VI secretion system secreted protein Hcp